MKEELPTSSDTKPSVLHKELKKEIENECKNCNRKLRSSKELDYCGYCRYMEKQGILSERERCLKMIEETLDFVDNFPLWLKSTEKRSKREIKIPEDIMIILEDFWRSQKELIKKELTKKINSEMKELK